MIKILSSIILVSLGAFLWWAFSPLLFDVEVQDELDPSLAARLEAQRQADEHSRISNENKNSIVNHTTEDEDGLAHTSEPVDALTSAPGATPDVFIDGPFTIKDTPSHPASGVIELIYSPEETLVRYKDYNGTNGPDLKVYLATDLTATDFIDLGPAKGNKGNLIYGVPLDIDLDNYKYVMTWCEAFSELFDYAKIN